MALAPKLELLVAKYYVAVLQDIQTRNVPVVVPTLAVDWAMQLNASSGLSVNQRPGVKFHPIQHPPSPSSAVLLLDRKAVSAAVPPTKELTRGY
jgi:hypothetical protein